MEKGKSQYYVGIGASAGGLEALESFFSNMPNNSGLVFIVIQHLSPDHKSLMNELLARHTDMPIHIIKDGIETKPNNIYLIPPRTNVSIYHDKLYLEKVESKQKLNLPIDKFFRSLAMDKEENAIGIILSGTGSDGTLGIRSIKEKGGLILVQDERSAKFDGMPSSSISTGLVDYILPPDKMPGSLIGFLEHPLAKQKKPRNTPITDDMDFLTKVTIILRDYSGIDFSYYKKNTIVRRIDRRITINSFTDINDYISLLKSSDKEKETLYKELLIGVTSFFRDKKAFESISKKVLPQLPYDRKSIRIWSAGCSTGEEVYSLAILINEYIENHKLNCDIKIFATDIDNQAIETAAYGYYSDSLVSDVDSKMLAKYFNKTEGGYRIRENIRKMIVFARHNVIKDPPFSKLDMLICRNIFIYFNQKVQQRILAKFFYSLRPDGYLFMGSSESIGEMSQGFDTIDSKWKIYKAKNNYVPTIEKEIEALPPILPERIREGFQVDHRGYRIENLLSKAMETSMPPSIIVDDNDQIVHVINDVNKFLSFNSGRFTKNLFSNVSKELGLFIKNVLRKAKDTNEKVIFDNINGLKALKDKVVRIEGFPLDKSNQFFLISFIEKEQKKQDRDSVIAINLNENDQIGHLEAELQLTKESLQATVEELETSNEELQSSNEELIASNEELQSTNEELQSVNEELYTVNNEHQQKIEELTSSNNDLANLLNNLDVGALYLDRKLCIRRITKSVTNITNIMQSDVGRPINHISVFSKQDGILKDIEYVNENLVDIEKEIIDNENRTWLLRIRPYRNEFKAVDGIIATFTNISSLKDEIDLKVIAQNRLSDIMEYAQIAWWEWNIKTGDVIYDDLKATMLGYTVEEFPNEVYAICDLIHPDDYDNTMNIMKDHLEGKTEVWNTTYRIKCKDGTYKIYHDQGKVYAWDLEGNPTKAKGSVIDVSEISDS